MAGIHEGVGVWVRFTGDYDFKATPGSTVAYKAGMVLNVPTRCATLAAIAGKAVRLKKTNKDEDPWPVNEPAQDNSASA